jgi:hypothetical protein
MPNTSERKHMPCVMCDREIYYETLTNAELQAPEMISGSLSSPGSWFGIIQDEDGVKLIACCTESCTRAMLIGGLPS